MSKSKNKLRFLLIFGYAAALMISYFNIMSDTSQGFTTTEEYNQKVRNALGEIAFPNSNSATAISSGTDGLSNFINFRSGIQMTQSEKNSLIQAEQLAWNENKRISINDLSDILSNMANDRLVTLSNSDIDNITNILRGFDAPGLPTNFQQGRSSVMLRSDGTGLMPATDFSSYLIQARDTEIDARGRGPNPPFAAVVQRSALLNQITAQVESTVNQIANAEPNFFGNPKNNMTPMQAVLVAYCVISDDSLVGNQSELSAQMTSMQQGASTSANTSYPSPSGFKAFGTNGYLYSSPMNYGFDGVTRATLIANIQGRLN
jgi:hypothetical protein